MDYETYNSTITNLILGANSSIDFISGNWIYREPGSPLIDLSILPDDRLIRRIIVSSEFPSWLLSQGVFTGNSRDLAFNILEGYSNLGWAVKLSPEVRGKDVLVIDNSEALIAEYTVSKELIINNVTSKERINGLINIFDRIWNSNKEVELLYEDLIRIEVPKYREKIVTISNDFYRDLIEVLKSKPELLYEIDPRKFEEIVAELLTRQGFDIHLTPKSKDAGYDIIANLNSPIGRLLYLVECKRYNKNRPVGIEIVNALYGLVEKEKATGGILVTTSRFTRGALETQKTLQNRLALHDYQSLKKWLNY